MVVGMLVSLFLIQKYILSDRRRPLTQQINGIFSIFKERRLTIVFEHLEKDEIERERERERERDLLLNRGHVIDNDHAEHLVPDRHNWFPLLITVVVCVCLVIVIAFGWFLFFLLLRQSLYRMKYG